MLFWDMRLILKGVDWFKLLDYNFFKVEWSGFEINSKIYFSLLEL